MTSGILTPRTVATAILIAFGVILFVRHTQDFSPRAKVPYDFKVYQNAVNRVQSGTNPYVQSEETPFKYSPAALVPLKLLPHDETNAWTVFKTLCLASLGASVLLGAAFHRWRDVTYLLIGLILSWKGLNEILDYGQMEFLILLGAVLAARCFARIPALSGLILGCLPWIKLPWIFVAVPFFLVAIRAHGHKSRVFLSGWAGGFAGMGLLVPVLAFGWNRTVVLMRSWLTLLAGQPVDLFLVDLNQSVWSTGARWIQMGGAYGVTAALIMGSVCLIYFARLAGNILQKRSFEPPLKEMTPWLLAMQLINPLAWMWGSLFLVGAPFAAEARIRSRSVVAWSVAGLAIALLILQWNPVTRMFGLIHSTALHHYGLITLYWASILFLCI